MNCEKMGMTKFLFTKIPFFKGKNKIMLSFIIIEIILSSFECPECGWKNTEV